MASIEKRGNKYVVVVSNGYDITGKKIREKATYTPDPTLTPTQQKKALEKFVFEFEQKVKTGNYLTGEKITFKDFAEKWLAEYGKPQLAATTYDGYKNTLNKRILPLIGHLKLSSIKPLQLQTLYNKWSDTELQPATIKKYHAIISVILKTAVQWQIIDSNPCDKVHLPKANRDMSDIKYFTPAQVNIFLEALNAEYTTTYKAHTRVDDTGKPYDVKEYTETRKVPTQLKIFYILALFTGLRRGELIGLTWEDIDFNNNMLDVNKSTTVISGAVIHKETKNKTSNRRVSIPSSIIPMLKAYKAEQAELRLLLGNKWEGDSYVFIQWNGKQMYPDTVSHYFRDLLIKHNNSDKVKNNRALELPLIPLHGLRHTNATLLIASNKIDIKTIQNHLGHANSTTTLNIYAHPLEELEKNCANTLENMINIAK